MSNRIKFNGCYLALLIDHENWSFAYVADALDITENSVRNHINGTSQPNNDTVNKYAVLFNESPIRFIIEVNDEDEAVIDTEQLEGDLLGGEKSERRTD